MSIVRVKMAKHSSTFHVKDLFLVIKRLYTKQRFAIINLCFQQQNLPIYKAFSKISLKIYIQKRYKSFHLKIQCYIQTRYVAKINITGLKFSSS